MDSSWFIPIIIIQMKSCANCNDRDRKIHCGELDHGSNDYSLVSQNSRRTFKILGQRSKTQTVLDFGTLHAQDVLR